MQTAARRDVEAAVRNDHDDDDEEKETPEMNITVALGVLIAATGLTCGFPFCGVKSFGLTRDVDLTAEALTDSLEGIGEVRGHAFK